MYRPGLSVREDEESNVSLPSLSRESVGQGGVNSKRTVIAL